MEKGISVIVCTFNRSNLLKDCLGSLTPEFIQFSKNEYEVIIINNNSSDRTESIAQEYIDKYDNFRYIVEFNQGLSYSKNRGYKEAKYNWITYLDDDAKAKPGYLTRAQYVINHFPFDCFGGVYLAWYKNPKPDWVPSWFGSKSNLRDDIGEIKTGFLSGSVSFYKKNILEELGGFPVHLGMKGNRVAYGEEDYLQIQMRKKGHLIGFDPDLKIDHLVNVHKLKPGWFIRSQFIQGKTNSEISGLNESIILLFWRTCKELLGRFKINISRYFRGEIDYKTFLVNVIYPFSYRIGLIIGKLNH
ncbi:MAG: glycosyltransferase family 2 protein [Cyclobacteriaceae bacterium]|nr:glycosyltransferase family 2 protein [Cyclobacteriaceae bacterium]